MFWMFLINTLGILMMWVAFWFLLIITQKGGKPSDKSQRFQLWFFLFVLQAGRSGQTNDCSLWVPGPASWQLWVKLADFCDCSLSTAAQPGLLLHGLPGVPSFGTIVRYRTGLGVGHRTSESESEQLGAAQLVAPVLLFCEHWQKTNKFKLNYLLKQVINALRCSLQDAKIDSQTNIFNYNERIL